MDAAKRRARRRYLTGRLDHLYDAVRRRREPESLLDESRGKMSGPAARQSRPGVVMAGCLLFAVSSPAQNRGVYPLGMSAINSGVTPGAGFTYVNQLLYYYRDEAKDNAGHTLPVIGEHYVLMDMNTLAWVSKTEIL